MSVQSAWLLHLLKKAQVKEDNSILVIPSEMTAGILVHQGQERETPIVKLTKYKGSLSSMLHFLKEQNYVDFTEQNLGKEHVFNLNVTHQGWHNWQTLVSKICSFLFRSVAVPVVVALLTSIATKLLLK